MTTLCPFTDTWRVMTGYELRLWRKGCGWTQDRAAWEFGVSLRTYQVYEKNKAVIPLLAERSTRELQLRTMMEELDALPKEQIMTRLRTLLACGAGAFL